MLSPFIFSVLGLLMWLVSNVISGCLPLALLPFTVEKFQTPATVFQQRKIWECKHNHKGVWVVFGDFDISTPYESGGFLWETYGFVSTVKLNNYCEVEAIFLTERENCIQCPRFTFKINNTSKRGGKYYLYKLGIPSLLFSIIYKAYPTYFSIRCWHLIPDRN